jgi:hypothetical protein
MALKWMEYFRNIVQRKVSLKRLVKLLNVGKVKITLVDFALSVMQQPIELLMMIDSLKLIS